MKITMRQNNNYTNIEKRGCNTSSLLSRLDEKEDSNINSYHHNNQLSMIISDASTGKIISVNDEACQFYGCSREEFLSKSIKDINILAGEDIDKQFSKVRANKEIRYDTKLKTEKGETRYLEVYISKLSVDNRDLIHLIILDITDKVKDTVELKESKDRYKKLIQLSPHSVFVHTGKEFIFVNKQGAKLLEVPHRKELIGQPTIRFTCKEFTDTLFEKFDYIKRKKKKIISKDMKVLTATGKEVDVSMSSSLITYDGEEVILTILSDISERKEKERLMQKSEEDRRKMNEMVQYDELRTEFFANISHELRTPINVILGSLQLLDKYDYDYIHNPDKLKSTVKTTKQNCFRLLRLINNLIDITKIDSDFFELDIKKINIVKTIEDIVLSVADYYIGSKKVNLIFDTNVEEKITDFDPDKLERIMLNLLSNAIKFSDSGDEIIVTVIEKEDKIIISVKDTGIGIKKDELNVIFERFRQANSSLTKNHGGSGIGLSLVKTFVDMHGGNITVESEYGKGSEFIMEFPCNKTYESNISQGNIHIENQDFKNTNNYVERINIEFSDIYS